jgi:iron complex outermembrane recepter protein
MKLKYLVGSLALLGLASHAVAQNADQRVTITGSSIKRIAAEGALPLQVITRAELDRAGRGQRGAVGHAAQRPTATAWTTWPPTPTWWGATRGNNGATSANLRGQGSNATLILLNGRRVAAHGLNGGTVDLNQIPLAAIERIEVLKDGASAIYGTDAIGGVINFILRTNFQGVHASASADLPRPAAARSTALRWWAASATWTNNGFNVLAALSVATTRRCAATSATSSTPSSPRAACRPTPAAPPSPRCSR